jgi:hypothetical protein
MKPWNLILAGALVACASSPTPTPAETQAVKTEGEEQAACVEHYDTKQEIDECRAAVRAKHGRAPR